MKRCGDFQPAVPFSIFNDLRFVSELKNLTLSFLHPIDTQSAVFVSREWKHLTIQTQKDILFAFGKSLGLQIKDPCDTLIKIKFIVKNNFIQSLTRLSDDDFEIINNCAPPPLFFNDFFYIAKLHQQLEHLDPSNLVNRTNLCMRLMKNGYVEPVVNHLNKNLGTRNTDLFSLSDHLLNEKDYECATILANLIGDILLKNVSLDKIREAQRSGEKK